MSQNYYLTPPPPRQRSAFASGFCGCFGVAFAVFVVFVVIILLAGH